MCVILGFSLALCAAVIFLTFYYSCPQKERNQSYVIFVAYLLRHAQLVEVQGEESGTDGKCSTLKKKSQSFLVYLFIHLNFLFIH